LDDNFMWKISLNMLKLVVNMRKHFHICLSIFSHFDYHMWESNKFFFGHLSKQHRHIFEFKKSPWIKGFPSLNLWDQYDFTSILWYIDWHTVFFWLLSLGEDWILCFQIYGNGNDFLKNSKLIWNFVRIKEQMRIYINVLMWDQFIISNNAKEVKLTWVKYYNKKCSCMSSDFTRFWLNSLNNKDVMNSPI
jgi:hypothetical protein